MSRLHSAAQAVLAMWDRCEIAPHPSSEGAHLAFDELRAALVPGGEGEEAAPVEPLAPGAPERCPWCKGDGGPCVHCNGRYVDPDEAREAYHMVAKERLTRFIGDGLAEIQQDARRIVMEGLRREMNAQMVAMMYGTQMGRAARSLADQGDPGPWGLEALEAEARRLAEAEAGR